MNIVLTPDNAKMVTSLVNAGNAEKFVNLVMSNLGSMSKEKVTKLKSEASVSDKQRMLYDCYLLWAEFNNVRPLTLDAFLCGPYSWASEKQETVYANVSLTTSPVFTKHRPFVEMLKKRI